jgi:hypothetical protein
MGNVCKTECTCSKTSDCQRNVVYMISGPGAVLVEAELELKSRSCRSLGHRIGGITTALWRAVRVSSVVEAVLQSRVNMFSLNLNIGVVPISHLQHHITARSRSTTHLSFYLSPHSSLPIRVYLCCIVRALPQCSDNGQAKACRVGTC